jgi:hypothetical protein
MGVVVAFPTPLERWWERWLRRLRYGDLDRRRHGGPPPARRAARPDFRAEPGPAVRLVR